MTRYFREEFDEEGVLYHQLSCGHIHLAENDRLTGYPILKQECHRCRNRRLLH